MTSQWDRIVQSSNIFFFLDFQANALDCAPFKAHRVGKSTGLKDLLEVIQHDLVDLSNDHLAVLFIGHPDFNLELSKFVARYQQVLDALSLQNLDLKFLLISLGGHPDMPPDVFKQYSEKNNAIKGLSEVSERVYYRAVWKYFQDPARGYLHHPLMHKGFSQEGNTFLFSVIKQAILRENILQ